MVTTPTDGPVHDWFGLSYSNYLVLPRTLMQSMPTEWQQHMVACLNELQDAYSHLPQPGVYKVEAATEHIVSDMTEAQLRQAGITEDWGDSEEQDEPTYSLDGTELDPHERVLLPATEPIPHYNRGRTYVEPRLSQSEVAR